MHYEHINCTCRTCCAYRVACRVLSSDSASAQNIERGVTREHLGVSFKREMVPALSLHLQASPWWAKT